MKRSLAAVLAVVTLVALAPAAHAAVRYRDLVFPKITTTKDLVYGKALGHTGKMQKLRLDVHQPAGDIAPLRAAVVWVHGGFFREGSKEDYRFEWEQFTKAGFVTFSIGYRLHPEIPHGAQDIVTEGRVQEALDATVDSQHDAQAAVRWVHKNAAKYRVDPDRVAIAGHSAGGITAQRVAYNDHDPGTSGNPGYSSRVNAAVSMAGGGIPMVMARVDFLEPPLIEIHGLQDDIVPEPAGPPVCLVALLYLNTCELVFDPDQDHGTFGHEFARDFLYRHMIAKPTVRMPFNVSVTGFP